MSGLLDGVRKAPAPEILQYSYRLTVNRDYHTSPRSGNTPDATVFMWWWRQRPGWRDSTGNFAEIYEPPLIPGTLLLGGQEDRWQQPYPGQATRVSWEVREGTPGKTYGETTLVDAPPSAEIKVPNEVCSSLVLEKYPNTSAWLTYTRGAYTTSHLKPKAVNWPKNTRSVVISCQAFDKSDGATLHPTADGYNLGEPRDVPGGVEIDPSRIWLAGQQLYWANHAVMLRVRLDKPDRVITPVVENVPWYNYNLEIVPGLPHQVAMAWSKHPLVTQQVDLQSVFAEGADILARDDDGHGEPKDRDDVPCYMEFFIIPAKRSFFPSNWAGADFTNVKYSNINRDADLGYLLLQRFANIKLVNKIDINGTNMVGAALINVPSIVLTTNCSGAVAMHEYGHTVGLEDRTNDLNMIMFYGAITGSEVTEWDGSAFYRKIPEVWFDLLDP